MAKRGNGEGTIRQRKNGLWEGLYTVGFDDNGKQLKKSVYGKTKREVVEKLATITNDIRSGLYLPPDAITFGEWLDVWHKEYLGGIKETTSTQYEYQMRVNIKPYLGDIKLQKLTTPMIQKLYRERLEDNLSAKSVKNLHGVIHKALDQAVRCRYLKFNPADACQLPRIEKKEMFILSEDHYLNEFLIEIQGKPHEDLFFVDLFTGMREGEILGLTWDCVDFKKEIIHVDKQLKRKQGNKNVYFFDTLKNGKKRVVSPAPYVFTVLRKVKRIQAENKMKHGSSFSNKDNLVFTDELGNHIGAECLLKCFKRRVTAIGCPEMRFHDLRHTYATLSLQNGDDPKTVSESLGHATVAFTLDVYGHVTEKMRKESADRMQSYINSLKVKKAINGGN